MSLLHNLLGIVLGSGHMLCEVALSLAVAGLRVGM